MNDNHDDSDDDDTNGPMDIGALLGRLIGGAGDGCDCIDCVRKARKDKVSPEDIYFDADVAIRRSNALHDIDDAMRAVVLGLEETEKITAEVIARVGFGHKDIVQAGVDLRETIDGLVNLMHSNERWRERALEKAAQDRDEAKAQIDAAVEQGQAAVDAAEAAVRS